MKIVISKNYNIYDNLALETYLLEQVAPGEHYLVIYQNQPCVVLGRFQNPFIECHFDKMLASNVLMARRHTGGGSVYHDLGNINWSFIVGERALPKKMTQNFFYALFAKLGVEVDIPEKRSDIFVLKDGKRFKVSGSAYKQKLNSSVHHGSMLISSNLHELEGTLRVKNNKVESKALASVKSEVMNLNSLFPLTTEDFIKLLVENAKDQFPQAELKEASLYSTLPEVEQKSRHYHNEKNLWAMTPKFLWHDKELSLLLVKGRVKEIQSGASKEEVDLSIGQLLQEPRLSKKLSPGFLQELTTFTQYQKSLNSRLSTF